MAAVHYKAPRRKCLVIEVLIIQKGQVARHNQREYYVYRGNNLILNETISNEYVSKKVRAISKNQRDRLPIWWIRTKKGLLGHMIGDLEDR